MDSRTIYLVGWVLGVVGLVVTSDDEIKGPLILSAGACIVVAAVRDRGRGRMTAQSGLSAPVRRGLAIATGSLWMFLGAWLLLNG